MLLQILTSYNIGYTLLYIVVCSGSTFLFPLLVVSHNEYFIWNCANCGHMSGCPFLHIPLVGKSFWTDSVGNGMLRGVKRVIICREFTPPNLYSDVFCYYCLFFLRFVFLLLLQLLLLFWLELCQLWFYGQFIGNNTYHTMAFSVPNQKVLYTASRSIVAWHPGEFFLGICEIAAVILEIKLHRITTKQKKGLN